jgi:ankyrin repeat protein
MDRFISILLSPYYGLCNSLLRFAARQGWIFLAGAALSMGADVNASKPIRYPEEPEIPWGRWFTIQEGWTALHHAAKNGDLEFVKFLVERGATVCSEEDNNLHANHSRHPNAPIFQALVNGYKAVVLYLQDQSNYKFAWVNYGLPSPNTSIMNELIGEAIRQGKKNQIELLNRAITCKAPKAFIDKLLDSNGSAIVLDDVKDKGNLLDWSILNGGFELTESLLQQALKNPKQDLDFDDIIDKGIKLATLAKVNDSTAVLQLLIDYRLKYLQTKDVLLVVNNEELPEVLGEMIADFAYSDPTELFNETITEVSDRIERDVDMHQAVLQANLKLLQDGRNKITGAKAVASQRENAVANDPQHAQQTQQIG